MMNQRKRNWMKGVLLAFVLALFASVSTTAFASSTTFTVPPNFGTPNTPSTPYITSYYPGGDEFFNWIQPSGTTHYVFAIYHSGGTYFTGLKAGTPGTSGQHYMNSVEWATIPHNEVVQITVNTYEYVSGSYVHNGSDYAYLTIIP